MSAPAGEKPPWRAASANGGAEKGTNTMLVTVAANRVSLTNIARHSGELFYFKTKSQSIVKEIRTEVSASTGEKPPWRAATANGGAAEGTNTTLVTVAANRVSLTYTRSNRASFFILKLNPKRIFS